ncbi:MAG: D-3-phosphoglycerate dehydrogenase [Arenicella sp.]|jgi:D-3-phosphoglycerate dehydrogenase
MKILANDGISPEGVAALEAGGFEVSTTYIPQDELIDAINNEGYVGVLVRSATTVRAEVVDSCPSLKLIGRGGVGMDNIDVDYARGKGLHVINTPAASSQSVAELVMGSLFTLSRTTFDSYKQMPASGVSDFKVLKKKYAKGQELRGKTLGIVGFGRIGQSLASYALGVGMQVKAVDLFVDKAEVTVPIGGHGDVRVVITPAKSLNEVISELDYISLHVPKQADGSAVIGSAEFSQMKDGVVLANAARGGVIDEDALISALNSGKVRAAALDVFENEPTPREDLLTHAKIASTPHIGAATTEAQTRIGLELASQIIELLK